MSNTESIERLWEKHMEAELVMKSTEATLATMTDDPRITLVPMSIDGRGREAVRDFYSTFMNQIPPDLDVVRVSRTVGEERLVDEMLLRFTHTTQVDWLLPGIAPTGKRIEFALVVVVHVRDGKIASETLYFDNATVLRQVGLLPDAGLPVRGAARSDHE